MRLVEQSKANSEQPDISDCRFAPFLPLPGGRRYFPSAPTVLEIGSTDPSVRMRSLTRAAEYLESLMFTLPEVQGFLALERDLCDQVYTRAVDSVVSCRTATRRWWPVQPRP